MRFFGISKKTLGVTRAVDSAFWKPASRRRKMEALKYFNISSSSQAESCEVLRSRSLSSGGSCTLGSQTASRRPFFMDVGVKQKNLKMTEVKNMKSKPKG